MSTKTYVLPFDPTAPQATAQADPAKLWPAAFAGGDVKAPKTATSRVFFNADGNGSIASLSSLGEGFANKKENERREAVRRAVGSAVKAVKDLPETKEVEVDATVDAHAAAVAAHLAQYKFSLKTPDSRFNPNLKEPIPEKLKFTPSEGSKEWERGAVYAKAQNMARTWMELPANMCTPTIFCEQVKEAFSGLKNVEVIVRDEAWAEEKGMRTFLSVTHGTSEPAKFLEIHYKGASGDAKPLVFVGKGITFDSGGISLKPGNGMKLMRGDMGGAATVVATAWAIATLGLPINLNTLTPLTENMPGPSATKPGDVIYAMNGKSVEVDNTDAEGRLVLADAIYYGATEYKPHTLIDVATLTGAMDIALGEVYAGVFSDSDKTWEDLNVAGEIEYDRFWRMPLSEEFGPQIYSSNADLQNTGGRPGGSCTAALFLKAFAEGSTGDKPTMAWAHIDIAGVMEYTRGCPYMEKGMTGRGVRGLVEYATRLKV